MELRSATKRRKKLEEEEVPASAPAPPRAKKKVAPTPKKVEYEFGGPVGTLLTMTFLPLVVVVLSVACDEDYCVGIDSLKDFPSLNLRPSIKPYLVVLGWILFQAVLQIVLPGPWEKGAPVAGGPIRLLYKINGHLAFWVSLLVMGHGWPFGGGSFPLSTVYDDFVQLAAASCVLSLAFGVVLYIASFRRSDIVLAEPGSTGVLVYDLFMGRELNPRIGSFDLKCFCELRPGLLGWLVLNLGCCAKRRELHGSVGLPLTLVTIFQGIYVWDALFFEKAILTTMDITTDGFGVMLAFGDLAWVPFTYSLQAKFLVHKDPGLSSIALFFITLLHCAGYVIFRGANSQKDLFRSNFDEAKERGMRYIETKSGRKLMISGFWGAARKINYFGDWLMSLSWCLLTGFQSPIPYFYSTYFAILLIHRAMRDDQACARKYGEDWTRYKKLVPSLFVPGIF